MEATLGGGCIRPVLDNHLAFIVPVPTFQDDSWGVGYACAMKDQHSNPHPVVRRMYQSCAYDVM